MTAPAITYPSGGQITPHGWYHLTTGSRPTMRLRAYDGSIDFYLMGGYAPPYSDPTLPEAVAIKELTGLIPPWQHIDQKGATQDGVTQIDALGDPIEVTAVVECIGEDARSLRKVHRDLIASIDAKQTSELSFLDLDAGYWWAPIRWFKGAPPDKLRFNQVPRQQMSLRLRADNGFWRSYDDTDSFRFSYTSMVDTFSIDYSGPQTLGPNWPQLYAAGAEFPMTFPFTFGGAGTCSTIAGGGAAQWYPSGTGAAEVVNGPYKDFNTTTDNQVIEITLGQIPGFLASDGAYDDIWGRMSRNLDGTWKGDGIRARVGRKGFNGWVQLSRFNNFIETELFDEEIFFWPGPGEKFGLICGVDDDPRMFRITRNGVPVLNHKEVGTGSMLGSAYRGVGFGMHAAAGTPQQGPAWVRQITAGDNSAVTQSGFLQRTNIGDQPMYDDYTFFGPGTVRIWNGPNAGPDDFIEFGPLLVNQGALLRTDPRDRNVYDLAQVPATPNRTEQGIFDAALSGLLSFTSIANVLLSSIQSVFGIFGGGSSPTPPQGNFYSLLKGRFSDASAIPQKSPGNPAQPYHVKVEIVGGNADSKVIASGIPLRRWPL